MDHESNVITIEQERYDIQRQLRKRDQTRNRQRKWRARQKERRLPSGVSRLQEHPGATPAPRGGVSRKVLWEREAHVSNLVKNWLQNHKGWTEARVVYGSHGAVSFNGRLNRGDKTFVLFRDGDGQFCLIRFSRAVVVAKGQAAADMFDNLVSNKTESKFKTLKEYMQDAWDVYCADMPDRRAVLAGKITHENELGFWLLVGALSHYGYASIDEASADVSILHLDRIIRRTGNPKLEEYAYSTQSWEIAKSLRDNLRARNKGKKAKLSSLESQLWMIQNHLKCFSEHFTDKKEFSWLKDGQFNVVSGEAEKQGAFATGVDSHKPFPLDTLKRLIFAAVKNGDRRYTPRTTTGKLKEKRGFVESRSLANSLIMRATIGCRPSELTRLKAEHFFGTQLQTMVTKTKVAESVPNPRASILARILKNEEFMDDWRVAEEFARHRQGKFSGFQGVDPKETAELVSYGLRATAVTNLLYICQAADKFKNKFVFLTKDQITYRTSHKDGKMIDGTYGRLNATMKNTPDPRIYYGFLTEKHQGKYEIKLDGAVYEISKYDTPYDCWLLRTWLEAWAAVDRVKANYYATLAVREFKLEDELLREPEYEKESEPEDYSINP